MKITYLHQYFNNLSMAGGTRSYEMARRLVAMGHEVTVITSWREPHKNSSWFESNESGIKVYWLPVVYSNNMGFLQRVIAFIKFAFFSAVKASSIESDIVFASSTPLTIALPAVFSSFRLRVPMVFEVRDLWPDMPIAMGILKNPFLIYLAKLLEVWAYRNSSAIVALSPGMKQGILQTGYPRKKIAVIPNSCDISAFKYNNEKVSEFRSARSWLGDSPLLIYAGTFGMVNGVSYLVDLASQLMAINSNVKVLLVGTGSERDSILRYASSSCVLGRNLFVESPIAKCDVPALFSASSMSSSVFIDLPEMRVNSANKFFDGLASGTPILLNYHGWMHDLVVKYDCGIAAWGRSMEDVARDVDCRLNDAVWMSRAGASASMVAKTFFDRDLLASQLEKVLSGVCVGCDTSAELIAPGEF